MLNGGVTAPSPHADLVVITPRSVEPDGSRDQNSRQGQEAGEGGHVQVGDIAAGTTTASAPSALAADATASFIGAIGRATPASPVKDRWDDICEYDADGLVLDSDAEDEQLRPSLQVLSAAGDSGEVNSLATDARATLADVGLAVLMALRGANDASRQAIYWRWAAAAARLRSKRNELFDPLSASSMAMRDRLRVLWGVPVTQNFEMMYTAGRFLHTAQDFRNIAICAGDGFEESVEEGGNALSVTGDGFEESVEGNRDDVSGRAQRRRGGRKNRRR